MENSNLKRHLEGYHVAVKHLALCIDLITQTTNPVKKAHHQRNLEQWTNKRDYHKDQAIKAGTQFKLIQVTGSRMVNIRPGLQRENQFKLYLTGLTIEDAKIYFQSIVKQKMENLILETISFKEIPLGILITQ